MHPMWPAAVLLVCAVCCRAEAEGPWIDARRLTVEGRGWSDPGAPFARLPARAEALVPPSVWVLSRQSAGIVVRFLTSAPQVSVRWDLTSPALDMPHMPATGVSGVDLYVRAGRGAWRFAQNGRPGPETASGATLTMGNRAAPREGALYLPLYNGVSNVQLSVEAPHRLEPAPRRGGDRERPIVVYGTSIVQGGCASRPGTAWTAIVGRRLEREVVNLGFSGSGQMEAAVIDLLAELDPAAFVLDCLWNMGGLPEEEQRQRIDYAARTLRRARPNTPILFVGIWPTAEGQRPAGDAIQSDVIKRLQREGLPALHLVPGGRLMGDDGDGTVDGVHPTDLGMMRQATVVGSALARALRQSR